MNKQNKIIIVGAGLCGSLLALRLAQKGFEVIVYEKRKDIRKGKPEAGRSINMALSARGLMALDKAGLKKIVLRECIPMRGRMVHPLGEEEFLSPYSGRTGDFINSISRSGLNELLIREADKEDHATFKFDARVTQVDLEEAKIRYLDKNGNAFEDSADIILGTDGAGSAVRQSMVDQSITLLFNYSQHFLRHGYKELSIYPGPAGTWKIHKEALHIWPRGDFMIIALPNLNGSFTLTMFHPFDSDIGFHALDSKEKVKNFFESYYPTLLPYIPHYLEEYFRNPVGTLGTIKCYPWQAYGKTLIMGDASHAIVPFYGQGMNASFEDVRVFDELLDQHGPDWLTVFKTFQEERQANTDAIADLAIDNFYEMRDKVDDLPFIRKRQVEMQLEQQFPDYYSKYSLVTFKPELPYEMAMKKGRLQDEILLEICRRKDFDTIPLQTYYERLKYLEVQ